MAAGGYRWILKEHIEFVESKIEYLVEMEKDEFLKGVLLHLRDYYEANFLKAEQNRLNNVKKLIYTVGKNNQGTAKGKLVYEVYQKLKANAISPEEAMDEVGDILMAPDGDDK